MLKNVLIADDNEMVIEALSKIIDWEKYNFYLVGKAYNGIEALEISRKINVDILLTDIKMPKMDGLELLRIISEEQPEIKVIVLSSYNEFSLVREAFKLGASEYMLKTELDPSFLVDLLIKLSKEQDEKKMQLEFVEELSNKVQKYINYSKITDTELYQNGIYIKDRLLNDLVRGYITLQEILEQNREYVKLRLNEGFYSVMYMSIDNYSFMLEKVWQNDAKLLFFAVYNVIEEVLESNSIGDAFYISHGDFCIIFSLKTFKKIEEFKDLISKIFEAISISLKNFLKLEISAGASFQENEESTLYILYAQANQACQLRVIKGKGSLIFSGENIKTVMKNDLKLGERLEYLKNILASLNPTVLIKGVDTIIINPTSVTVADFDGIIHLYQKYSMVLFDFIEQNNLEKSCKDQIDKFDKYIYNMDSVTEMNKWLKATIEVIARGLATGNSLVRKAKKHIDEHFSEELSLQSVAEIVGVTNSYISKLIVKELGVTFTEYINDFRIEKAKELIQNSNLKIYEISEKVGYGSIENFSRVFKRKTGKSPKEFASGS